MDNPIPAATSPARVSLEGLCEVWLENDQVWIESKIEFTEWRIREFSRQRIHYEGKNYYLLKKETPSPKVFRYLLNPWPEGESTTGATIYLDAQYMQERKAEIVGNRSDTVISVLLTPLYPLLGYLWVPQKRWLRAIGFEVNAMSGVSNMLSFGLVLLLGILIQVHFRAGKFPIWMLITAPLLLLDAIARYHRSLKGEDEINPGLFEWLLHPKKKYD